MLSYETVKEMADLIFNGNPDAAYTLFHSRNEWHRFTNSIQKDENDVKLYYIMCKSDLSLWRDRLNAINEPDRDDPVYDIGY